MIEKFKYTALFQETISKMYTMIEESIGYDNSLEAMSKQLNEDGLHVYYYDCYRALTEPNRDNIDVFDFIELIQVDGNDVDFSSCYTVCNLSSYILWTAVKSEIESDMDIDGSYTLSEEQKQEILKYFDELLIKD